jgi:hypothetical protein
MKLAIATALAAISLAGSVFAETTVTATLNSAQAAPSKFIAASAVWNCAGTTCVATIAPDDATGVSGCKELAKKIGHIASYATESRSLDAKGLERCNIAATTPQATASR